MKLTAKTILLAAEVPPLEEGTEITIRTTADQLTWGAYLITPLLGLDSVDIDNGDGTVTELKDGEKYEHTYAAPGVYRIHIPDQVKTLAPSFRTDNIYSTVYAPMITEVRSVATHINTLAIGGWRGCKNMVSFDMREAPVLQLRGVCFEDCSALRSLAGLPKSATKISNNCFRNCASLSGCIDLLTVLEIEPTKAEYAPFQGCPRITELRFPEEAREAIMANPLYDIAFGAENAVVKFVL